MYDLIEINQTTEGNSIPVLHLMGRLDAAGAQRLHEICSDLRNQGETGVVIDLARVEFVASSGLGIFLRLNEEFRDAGGKIIFASSSSAVLDVIGLLNLDKFLSLESSLAKALEAVRNVIGSPMRPGIPRGT